MFDALIARGRLCTLEELPRLVIEHAASAGLTGVVIYPSTRQDLWIVPMRSVRVTPGEHRGQLVSPA